MTSSSAESIFTPNGFRGLARRALLAEPAAAPIVSAARHAGPSDYDLNPGAAPDAATAVLPKPAAVLVAAVAHPVLTLLLTQRTEHLPSHPGQIAFPGGKMEPADDGPLATALREAREEIGLDPALVEPLGYLDSYLTGTGYRITPVVALVDPGFTLELDRNEVADAFEVPLPFLMDATNHQRHARTIAGRERHFHAIPFGDRFIWGATAGMLRNLHERLFAA